MRRIHYQEGVKLEQYCLTLNPEVIIQFDLAIKPLEISRSEAIRIFMKQYIEGDKNGGKIEKERDPEFCGN